MRSRNTIHVRRAAHNGVTTQIYSSGIITEVITDSTRKRAFGQPPVKRNANQAALLF